ncbi:hypothetical protein V6N12_016724 [Hibiscus sabdariffa]|uniref:Uncharacterized protein n=1 Tax=Hibiscus sabdariffa TaxID=183260 RepID=A0ABR2CG66_9ROSI
MPVMLTNEFQKYRLGKYADKGLTEAGNTAGPSGFGTSATTAPPFCFNQQKAYPTFSTPTANLGLQQPPFGYQSHASFRAAPQGDFSTSYSYSGN